MANFADRLKELRKDKGLSQRDIAEAIGTSNGSINVWEHGYSKPNSDAIIALASFFEVSTDYLLGVRDY